MATATVTVLFTDLVGSTALLSSVGAELNEALRREHFALLRKVVEATDGHEVKNLGDGLMVVFTSAAEAVAAAVAMQQAIDARNRRAEHPLAIRIGLAAGDTDVDDGDYFGVPVVQAARLCARAEGAEILVTDLVRLLCGSRGSASYESVGEQELKGLDELVATSRVLWAPLESADAPPPALPPRLATAVSADFVGRVEEHELLRSAWKVASVEADRRVALLAGEPGIGKTTLAAQFARDVHADGAIVIYGRSDEGLGIPYQPWLESLGQLVGQTSEDLLTAHVADCGATLSRLVPALGRRVGGVDGPGVPSSSGTGEIERYALFGCVTDLLERVSMSVPVLMVLDDLHWADRQSLRLFRHVVTCGRPMRLVVLGTFRDSDVSSGDPTSELLAALHREHGVERISMRGLRDDDLLEMLERSAGHDMDDAGLALRDALLEETAGNPFFVGEVLRHLTESGAIYQSDDGRWVGPTAIRAVGLPVSVREVVGRRLDALGPDTGRVLSYAAVIGRDFDIGLLAAVSDVDVDAVIDLCDAAVAAAVLQATGDADRYTFAHALIEHTLYDGLSPARRTRAHRAVAERLEAEGGDLGRRAAELAHHWAAAVQPADATKAIRYAQLAGVRALEQLAPDDALGWFGRALEQLDQTVEADPRLRAELLLGLGNAQRECGIGAHRETLLEAARLADRLDEVDLLVDAALANSQGGTSSTGAPDDERLEVIDLAIERIGAEDRPERARLLALALIERLWTLDEVERLRRAHEACAVARRTGHFATLAHVLVQCADAVPSPETLALRLEWLAEASELCDPLAEPTTYDLCYSARAVVALEAGDPDLIQICTARMEARERLPTPGVHWSALLREVWRAVLRGDLERAEGLAVEALETGLELGRPDAVALYSVQLSSIRHHQGRLHELAPLIEQVLEETPALMAYRAALASAYSRSSQPERAVELLDEAVVSGMGMRLDHSWTTAHAAWSNTAVLVGHDEVARIMRGRLEAFHAHVVTTKVTVQPVIAYNLGRLDHHLGSPDDAERWFDEADAVHRRLDSPLLIAYSDVARAELLVDRARADDLAQARRLAEGALAAATAGGFGYIADDSRAVLERVS